jgi:hypothetical protein
MRRAELSASSRPTPISSARDSTAIVLIGVARATPWS